MSQRKPDCVGGCKLHTEVLAALPACICSRLISKIVAASCALLQNARTAFVARPTAWRTFCAHLQELVLMGDLLLPH